MRGSEPLNTSVLLTLFYIKAFSYKDFCV